MTKHTPGPWNFYDDSNDGKTNRIEIVAVGKTVARIYHSVPAEDLPNARLIAAAPELLEALQIAAQAFSEMHHARTRPDWFTKGRAAAIQHEIMWSQKGIQAVHAAIAKATGEQA